MMAPIQEQLNISFKKVSNAISDEDDGAEHKLFEEKEVLWNGRDLPSFNRNVTGSALSSKQRKFGGRKLTSNAERPLSVERGGSILGK